MDSLESCTFPSLVPGKMAVFHLVMMMMIAFITLNSSLVPLIEGLCSSNPLEFEFSGVRRNRTDDLGINSHSL